MIVTQDLRHRGVTEKRLGVASMKARDVSRRSLPCPSIAPQAIPLGRQVGLCQKRHGAARTRVRDVNAEPNYLRRRRGSLYEHVPCLPPPCPSSWNDTAFFRERKGAKAKQQVR